VRANDDGEGQQAGRLSHLWWCNSASSNESAADFY